MKKSTRNKLIKWLWIIVAAPFALIFLLLLLVWAFAKIPSFDELEHPDSKLATQIIAEGGEVLTTFHIENRTYVPYDELSVHLVNAAVSTEDVRFYSHSGVDTRSLMRVLVKTLLMHDSSQGGGSTITQQLAKTLYPRREVNSPVPGWSKVVMVWTKLKEWITAVKIERNYTKNEIVDMYLNSVFFGGGAYGVKAASETFFGKAPSDLGAEEAATLIGMLNKPTRYNPVLNPENSIWRRNVVLGRMCKNKCLSKRECDSLCALPMTVSYTRMDHNSGVGPYFRDMIRRDMNASEPKRSGYQWVEDYRADSLRWATDEFYGWLNKNSKPDGSRYDLDRDGLKIYTTINYKMQQYAEQAVAEHLGKELQKAFDREMKGKSRRPFASDVEQSVINTLMKNARRWSDRYRSQKQAGVPDSEIMKQFDKPVRMRVFSWNRKGYADTTMTPNDSIRYYKGMLRAGFMVMEPSTGHIKAYVGGPNYRYFKFDNVRQSKRQVGSTIKPFLYTLAMQEGLSPCDKVVNVPQTFVVNDQGETWTPRSTDKEEWLGRTVTLKWGLTHSSNNISAYLMRQFGPAAMAKMMRKMGIHSHVDEVYSLCVGPADISLFEMVSAYNTFPSKGVYVTPLSVTRITDSSGNVLGEFTNSKREAISDRTAFTMVNLMRQVVDHGTGYRLRAKYRLTGQIAGKTGTTNDNSDGWFIGYTPNLTGGVWVGGEDRQIHFNSIALGGGSNMALPIWGIFMKKCLADGTLGISGNEVFTGPAGMELEMDCEGGDISETYEGSGDSGSAERYFD